MTNPPEIARNGTLLDHVKRRDGYWWERMRGGCRWAMRNVAITVPEARERVGGLSHEKCRRWLFRKRLSNYMVDGGHAWTLL